MRELRKNRISKSNLGNKERVKAKGEVESLRR